MATLNGKNILNLKNPLTCSHWEEQNYRVFLKNLPFTYLELGSRNAPCFHKKFEKYFLFGCGTAYFYLPKNPFTYLELE